MDLPLALFAMTNPSGADMSVGDSTVLKTARTAQHLGCRGQIIVNACAYRTVSPRLLLTAPDPVGPNNLLWITAMVDALRATRRPLFALKFMPDGTPMHPLARGRNYIQVQTPLVPYQPLTAAEFEYYMKGCEERRKFLK